MGHLTRDQTWPLPALLILCVLCTLPIVNCDRTENEDRYLKIPALGRTAHLGHLYDEVLDDFRDVSVFSQKIPEEFITKAIKPKLTTVSGPANSYQEIFKLLNIQETVAANVLSDFTKVDGSASFLNDENFQSSAPNEGSGLLIQKYRTVKESLEFYFSKLKGLYNVNVLNHKVATHVITGITYGTDIAVLFKGNGNTTENSERAKAQLYKEMKLLTGTELEAKAINSNFTMSLTSDVRLPFKTSTNLSQVYNLLQEMPTRISNFTEGKGVPVSFILTPLTVIKRFVLPSSEPSNFAKEINDWILKDIVSDFDEIHFKEQQIKTVYETLNSQPNCLLEDTQVKIKILKSLIHKVKSNFSKSLKNALEADRSGSDDGQALFNMSQNYRQHELNADKIKEKISKFKDDLKRTVFCAELTASYPNIEYIGRQQNFDWKISQHFNQSVYILFTKAEFTNKTLTEWQANLSTFLNQLNQPGNKLYIVDCDFEQAMCRNVSQSVIHLYRNGRLVSPKVERVYEEEVSRLELKISQLNSTLANMSAAVTDQVATVEAEVTKLKNEIISQRTGLTTVKNIAVQNRNHTSVDRTCQRAIPALFFNATKSASFGCGGIIQLPSKGESIVLDFNLASTNGSSQRCLWTLDATQSNIQVKFKVNLTLLCKSPMDVLDGNTLTFTEWYSSKEITTNRISSSSQNSFLLNNEHTYRVFLSFNSKTMSSEAGFILRVEVLETTALPSRLSSTETHRESIGSVSHSLPSASHDFDWSSIIINPQPAANVTMTVDVDSGDASNPCQSSDSVDILEFGMDGVTKRLGRLCGPQATSSYKTENPVAVLFIWIGGRSGKGLKLSWK